MAIISTAVTLLAAGAHPAGAGSGFRRAVAGTGPAFLAFLAIHVPAGLTAVISGALAATAPKRHGRHTQAGAVYYWAITVVFATAAAMAAIRPARDWYLALLGALAFTLATAGRDYRRHPDRRPWRRWPGHTPHIIAMGSSYTVLLTAFYVDNGKNLPLWDRLPTAAYWTLPALVAAPVIGRSAARHRHPRPAPPAHGPTPRCRFLLLSRGFCTWARNAFGVAAPRARSCTFCVRFVAILRSLSRPMSSPGPQSRNW